MRARMVRREGASVCAWMAGRSAAGLPALGLTEDVVNLDRRDENESE